MMNEIMKTQWVPLELRNYMTVDFLRSILNENHYSEKDMKQAAKIAGRLWQCLGHETGCYCSIPDEIREKTGMPVVMTLGSQVDILREEYERKGLMEELYLLEVICFELLREGYQYFFRWVEHHTKWFVSDILFYGDSVEYPLADIPEIIRQIPECLVSCNAACYLSPSKSVVFFSKRVSEKQGNCGISTCSSCDRTDCLYRKQA